VRRWEVYQCMSYRVGYVHSNWSSTVNTLKHTGYWTHSILQTVEHNHKDRWTQSYRLFNALKHIGCWTHSIVQAAEHVSSYRLLNTFNHTGCWTHSNIQAAEHIQMYKVLNTLIQDAPFTVLISVPINRTPKNSRQFHILDIIARSNDFYAKCTLPDDRPARFETCNSLCTLKHYRKFVCAFGSFILQHCNRKFKSFQELMNRNGIGYYNRRQFYSGYTCHSLVQTQMAARCSKQYHLTKEDLTNCDKGQS
jgi:hypothetical protein